MDEYVVYPSNEDILMNKYFLVALKFIFSFIYEISTQTAVASQLRHRHQLLLVWYCHFSNEEYDRMILCGQK